MKYYKVCYNGHTWTLFLDKTALKEEEPYTATAGTFVVVKATNESSAFVEGLARIKEHFARNSNEYLQD